MVSVLAWLAAQTTTIKLGAAILQVPARPAGRRGDGRRDDRQTLRRSLPLRLRPLRPAGLRGLVRRALREALGPHPRVHRSRARDHRPRGPGQPPGRALPAAAARRRGQGAEAQLPPRCATRSRSSSARSAANRSRWRRRSATAGSRSSSASTPSRRPGASTSRPASPRAVASAPTSRSRPSLQVAIDGDLEAAKSVVKAGLVLYFGGMGSRKTNFYVDLAHRFGFGDVADEVQQPLPGRRPRRRLRGDAGRDRRGHLAGRHRGRGGRADRALPRRRHRPPDRLAGPRRPRPSSCTRSSVWPPMAGVADARPDPFRISFRAA